MTEERKENSNKPRRPYHRNTRNKETKNQETKEEIVQTENEKPNNKP